MGGTPAIPQPYANHTPQSTSRSVAHWTSCRFRPWALVRNSPGSSAVLVQPDWCFSWDSQREARCCLVVDLRLRASALLLTLLTPSPAVAQPDWYHTYDPEQDARRWAKLPLYNIMGGPKREPGSSEVGRPH